jgi:hypothetical protein
VAVPSVSETVVAGRVASIASARAAALALALPLVFLHVDYQPGVTVSAGSTEAHVYLSDFAVLAVGLAALAAGLHSGFAPLRNGKLVWLAGGALVALVLAASLYPLALDETYHWRTHLVTAGKFAEYGLLAPAVPLLLRNRRDLQVVLVALTAWSAAATVVGVGGAATVVVGAPGGGGVVVAVASRWTGQAPKTKQGGATVAVVRTATCSPPPPRVSPITTATTRIAAASAAAVFPCLLILPPSVRCRDRGAPRG